jgi:glutamate carboxypeptidase
MTDPAALPAAIARELPAALTHLRDWVGINSWTHHADGVNALGQSTAAAFAPLGFTEECVPCVDKNCGRHLFLRRAGHTRQTLLCISHLDTVFSPEEERREHFHWREAEGRIYGPGVVDIKGGTALLWLQLAAMQAAAPKVFDHFSWAIGFNAAEEILGDDFAQAALTRFGDRAAAALVYESGASTAKEFNVVVARKGRAIFRVTAMGRGAHAGSRHGDGANAIAELARVVPQLEALTNPAGELTVNVGLIRGGEAHNRVPHAATAEGEFRAFAPEVLAQTEKAILALAGPGEVAASADGYRCHIEAEIAGRTPAWPENAATRPLLSLYESAAIALGRCLRPERRGGLSDGNFLAPHLPTLDGLGPAGGNAHASEWSDAAAAPKRPEYLEPASLPTKALLNALVVEALAKQ